MTPISTKGMMMNISGNIDGKNQNSNSMLNIGLNQNSMHVDCHKGMYLEWFQLEY